MPVRQATPGPSTGIVLQQQQINARKRSLSEPDNEGYSTGGKKLKQDEENAVKDKAKKNRRRRRRKQSITAAQMSPRSTSRSAPATQQKAGSSVLDTQSPSNPPNVHETECGLIEITVNDAAPEVVSHSSWLCTVYADALVYRLVQTKEKERLKSHMRILSRKRHCQKDRSLLNLPKIRSRDLPRSYRPQLQYVAFQQTQACITQ
jgi:hypothetical protein